jgi:predicted nucleic-acid-binding Zn-ribbon protein
MKGTKQCPKCKSRRVGHIDQVNYGDAGPCSDETYKPLPLGIIPVAQRWVGPKQAPVGQFEAYVCASCGYFETYLKDLSTVPFEKIEGFRWLNAKS